MIVIPAPTHNKFVHNMIDLCIIGVKIIKITQRSRQTQLMPYSHSTEPVSPFLWGLRVEAGGGCDIFVWIHGLRGL